MSSGPWWAILPVTFGLFTLSCSVEAAAAQQHGVVKKGDESIRTLDLDAPCTFEKVYAQIKADKTDPRVAFIETFQQLHANQTVLGYPSGFQAACKNVSNQTVNTQAFYDPTHRFFQIFVPSDPTVHNETLTYFAGSSSSPDHSGGVMLSFSDDMGELKTVALVYRHDRWEDATAEYLTPLKVGGGGKDFLILPQYGHTARVLTSDHDADQPLRHRGWLAWNGKQFSFSPAPTRAGWRCPDNAVRILSAYFPSSAPKQRLPDFCRMGGGESAPEPRK